MKFVMQGENLLKTTDKLEAFWDMEADQKFEVKKIAV